MKGMHISDNLALLLSTVTLLSGVALASSRVSAEDPSVVDQINITVPVACTMSGTGQTSHNATLNPGTYSGASGSEYEAGIGKTTLTTYCNDNNGFSIYAIGFTGDLYKGESHTKLIGQNTNQSISTKVYANGDTDSNWSMKVTKVDNPVSGDPITYNPDNMSIQNSFNSWHVVPDVYTKVAQYNSNTTDPATTDTTLGAKLETTYATYISSSQPADTYTGQVKYTLVHPYDTSSPATITMQNLNIADCPTTATRALDSRDGTLYNIQLLADGNCWLLDNLAIDLTNPVVQAKLNSTTTNASDTTLEYLINGGGTTSDKYPINGVNSTWLSSADNSFSEPKINLSNKNVIPEDDLSVSGAYKIGGYYNFCAATAGSYCYGNGTSPGSSSGHVTEDICPAGWRLATGYTTTREYQKLTKAITGNTSNSINSADALAVRAALHLPVTGYYYDGQANRVSASGSLWTTTRYDNRDMDIIAITPSMIIMNDMRSRMMGYSVRCLLKQ